MTGLQYIFPGDSDDTCNSPSEALAARLQDPSAEVVVYGSYQR